MNQEKRDRELGMGRRITRRDFLNGVAVGIGALGTAGLIRVGFRRRTIRGRAILRRDSTRRLSRV